MGTRSTIKFYSEFDQEKPLLSIYKQFDGYIDGVGYDLANFLKGKKVINGYNINRGGSMDEGYANGMGCLAAQYVVSEKKGIGGFYCTTDDDFQEYNYEVRFIDGQFEIKVDEIFKGTPEELLNYKET